MSVTASTMIDETIGLLQSWVWQEQVSTLAVDLSAVAIGGQVTTTRSVATGMTTGVVEIGSELLYVDSITQATGAFTTPAWGRGYRNTTPAAHATGTKVISQPVFPRAKIFDYLNECIQRIFPEIFAVKSFETTTVFPQMTYDLPDDCQRVLKVKWLVPDGRQYWKDVPRWRLSAGGGTQPGDQGITVDLLSGTMMPGRPIQFLYASQPTPLVSESSDFESTTGLTTSLRDVVELGAASKAVAALEIGRLQTGVIEQQNRSGQVSPGAALNASKFLEQFYQQRVIEERKALQVLYPPRVSREWV